MWRGGARQTSGRDAVIMGYFLLVTKKNSLQGLTYDSIGVTDAGAHMHINVHGFDPSAFQHQGAVGENLPTATNLTFTAGAFVTIYRQGGAEDAAALASSTNQVSSVRGVSSAWWANQLCGADCVRLTRCRGGCRGCHPCRQEEKGG